MSLQPGSLVSFRERDWVVLPSPDPQVVRPCPTPGFAVRRSRRAGPFLLARRVAPRSKRSHACALQKLRLSGADGKCASFGSVGVLSRFPAGAHGVRALPWISVGLAVPCEPPAGAHGSARLTLGLGRAGSPLPAATEARVGQVWELSGASGMV